MYCMCLYVLWGVGGIYFMIEVEWCVLFYIFMLVFSYLFVWFFIINKFDSDIGVLEFYFG